MTQKIEHLLHLYGSLYASNCQKHLIQHQISLRAALELELADQSVLAVTVYKFQVISHKKFNFLE